MRGDRTLVGQPFRYGGIQHNYERTWEQWDERVKGIEKCYCCGRRYTELVYPDNLYPYLGVYKITRGRDEGCNKLRIICRECAYDYGRGVVEMDGETYTDYYAFDEGEYKNANK